jgi:hypothetical protein
VTTFELFTGADSEDNVRLYERLGYRQVRLESLPQGPGLVYLHKRRGPAAPTSRWRADAGPAPTDS